MEKIIRLIILMPMLFCEFITLGQRIPIDSASYYFRAYKSACELDDGKLWGINLYINQIVIDKKTRYVVSNFKDTLGILKPYQGLFAGYLPDTINPEQLGFSVWVHKWPTSSINKSYNTSGFIHEAFHYFQAILKIKPEAYNNKHMNETNARIGIKMECYFLMKAVLDSSKAIDFINEAMKCRLWRQKQYPENIGDEQMFELHEGLAQYTGNYIACKYFNAKISKSAIWDYYSIIENPDTSIANSFERSFGYASGQFYAILLDRFYPKWRSNLSGGSDLAVMLKDKLNLKVDTNKLDPFVNYKDSLKFREILNIENKREKRFEKYKFSILERFNNSITLSIPIDTSFHFQFNTRTMLTFDDGNFYFPYFNASGNWGEIKVSDGGGIFYKDSVKLILKSDDLKISNNHISVTDNWNLVLKKGWGFTKNGENYYISTKQPRPIHKHTKE